MRRTLFAASVGAAFAVILALNLPLWAGISAVVLLLAAVLCCVIFRRRPPVRRMSPVIFAAFAACLFSLVFTARSVWPVLPLAGKQADVAGVIVEEPKPADGRYVYIVETARVGLDGAPQKMRLRLYSRQCLGAGAFDQITASVRFYEPGDMVKGAYYADGIYLCASLYGGAEVTPVLRKPLYYRAIQIRGFVRGLLYERLSYEEASVLSGLVLGDTFSFPEELSGPVRASGLSHLMAVSGTHLAILCQLMFTGLQKLRCNRRISALLTMGGVVSVMAVTGFSGSVVRAGLTYLMMLSGMLVFRKADPLNSLGAAVLLMLAVSPCAAFDVSFQLSVLASLGMILLCPPIYRLLTRRVPENRYFRLTYKGAAMITAQTLAATIATLPAVILTFGQVSLISPVSNLFVCHASTLALVLTAAAAFGFALPFLSFIGSPLLLGGGLLAKYMVFGIRLFGGLPFASVPLSHRYIGLWLAFTLLLSGAVLFFFRAGRRPYRLAALLSACLLMAGSLSCGFTQKDIIRIAVLDDPAGVAVMVTKNGRAMMIGAGSGDTAAWRAKDYLRSLGAEQLDLVLLPGLEENTAGGAVPLLRQLKSRLLLAPDTGAHAAAVSAFSAERLPRGPLDSARIRLWENVTVSSVKTGTGYTILLQIGATAVMLTAPGQEMGALPEDWPRPQLLISGTAVPSGFTGGTVVVSGSSLSAEAAAGRLARQSSAVYVTGGRGDLFIITKGNGDLAVTREP